MVDGGREAGPVASSLDGSVVVCLDGRLLVRAWDAAAYAIELICEATATLIDASLVTEATLLLALVVPEVAGRALIGGGGKARQAARRIRRGVLRLESRAVLGC